MVDAFDVNSQGTGFESQQNPVEQATNNAAEMRKYLEANPEATMTMFRVFANLFDEPRQVKSTQE